MKIDAPDRSVGAVFSMRSIGCAPDVVEVCSAALRVLKPGVYFAAYEYSPTDRCDSANAEPRRIKGELDFGDRVTDIPRQRPIDAALWRLGFELLEARDLTAEGACDNLWNRPLVRSRGSFIGFRRQRSVGS